MIQLPEELLQHLPVIALCLSVALPMLILSLLITYLRLRESHRQKNSLQESLNQQHAANETLQQELTQAKVRCGKLVTILQHERRTAREKLSFLDHAREKLSLQFQTLANQIFEQKSERFSQESKERVSAILQPVQQQLHGFQQRINDIQADEIRERTSLKEEIAQLRELNKQINQEATNLTRALKGDKRLQGSWGELVLEKLLEQSGLRKGREYSVQEGFRTRDNLLQKPDVIVHLPDGKDIVIDSKVSLIAWERFVNANDEKERLTWLKQHITHLRSHIKQLSDKDYSSLPTIQSLDFVLLFIPIDSSYTVASQEDEKLFTDAYNQRIILVTPATLLATLRTIENLWRFAQQNRNAKDIADRAAAIYDKLRGFLEEMEKIGKQISTCHSTYESAMNKLVTGRGNLLSQANKLTELGVSVKKEIPRSIQALSDSEYPN